MNRLMSWPIAISLAATLTACSDGGPMGTADGTTRVSPGAGTAPLECEPGTGQRDPRIQIPDDDASTGSAQDGCSADEKTARDPRIQTGETSG